ncbi:MAG: alkaline phosphatase [Cytophagales bacterium]|nr:alkaline phosphatase [Cytophagales bacterium]
MKFLSKTYLLAVLIIGCQGNTDQAPKPRNIILMIGDGMGLSQVSSAFYYQKDSSNFYRFTSMGLIKTSSTSKVTDSAAGATAMSTGVTTYNGAISVDPDSIALETIVDILSLRGWKTGVVSTSSIQHATPAAFYAHNKSRRNYEEISLDLVDSNIDFFAGGGYAGLTQRPDSINLLDSLSAKGIIWDTLKLAKSTDPEEKYGFLLSEWHMPPASDGRGDFLSNAVKLAIDYCSTSNDPFFLMVEGSQIDWGGHENEPDYLISELLDFDKTIGAVLDFAERDGNTLVIVTADHETGGFTLATKDHDYNKIEPTFSTTGHSATLIPVFAFGPEAEKFTGIYKNTAIFDKMMEVVGE